MAYLIAIKQVAYIAYVCSAPYAYIGPYAYGTSHIRVFDIPYAYGPILCSIRVWASHMSMHA